MKTLFGIRRHHWFIPLLGFSILLSLLTIRWWSAKESESNFLADKSTKAAALPSSASITEREGLPESNGNTSNGRPSESSLAIDIFAVRTWEPPRPSVVFTPPPPAPPQPPALPFRFLGKVIALGETPAFLLAYGDQILSLHIGDTVDGKYLVEKYEGGQLHFLFRPMNAHQTLFVGSDT